MITILCYFNNFFRSILMHVGCSHDFVLIMFGLKYIEHPTKESRGKLHLFGCMRKEDTIHCIQNI